MNTETQYQKLLDVSFHLLSYRPRSEKEIKDFLRNKIQKLKIDDISIISKVVDRLRGLGYVDDRKFVNWWIEQRSTYRPKGKRLLEQELKAKGVSDDLVKSIVVKRRDQFSCDRNEIGTDDELALAKRALEKKTPQWRRLSKLEQKKKIYGFLGRRGFDGETIHRVIDEVTGGEVEYP